MILTSRLLITSCILATTVSGDNLRQSASRLRTFNKDDPSTYSFSNSLPDYGDFFKSLAENPLAAFQKMVKTQKEVDAELDQQKNEFDEFMAAFKKTGGHLSMDTSAAPSVSGSQAPSAEPSSSPSAGPAPTKAPSVTQPPSSTPSISLAPSSSPSDSPSVSVMPSSAPSPSPSAALSSEPTISSEPSAAPSVGVIVREITFSPTANPTSSPTDTPTAAPSSGPTIAPTDSPTASPTVIPTSSPTSSPTVSPTSAPTFPAPTSSPTVEGCGISAETRNDAILAALDAVANPAEIRNSTLPQGLATEWLLNEDEFRSCPDDDKLVQRWVMAVIYFSTNGPSWFQCSASPGATDACGAEEPFDGKQRFLSPISECEWAGISCIDGCVTEIEFEENNLVGTIPTEIGLLHDLAIWGMERGGLSSTIPTEIASLTNLIFLDFDFNQLTGSLSSELLSLSSLTQLDLNNNQLTGSINGIGVFPNMEFLQLHANFFSGTVPDAVGTYTNLAAFTLHETAISGVMPQSVCDLLTEEGNGGILSTLIADCNEPAPDIVCDCCTDCRTG